MPWWWYRLLSWEYTGIELPHLPDGGYGHTICSCQWNSSIHLCIVPGWKPQEPVCHFAMLFSSNQYTPTPTTADTRWAQSKWVFVLLGCQDLGAVCYSSLTDHILTDKEGHCNWQVELCMRQDREVFRGQIVKSFVASVKKTSCHSRSKGKSLKIWNKQTDFIWRRDGKVANS